MRSLICLLAAVLTLLVSPTATADLVAVDNLGSTSFSIFGEGTLGWEFQTIAPIQVTSLGFFDHNDDCE